MSDNNKRKKRGSHNVIEAFSPLGYIVVCDKSSWEHIAHNHKIMIGNEQAMKEAIENPLAIFKSEEWQDRDVYFGVTEKATYATKLITKVVVDVPTKYDDKGRVVSSWPQKEMKGNISQKGLKYVKHKSGQKK